MNSRYPRPSATARLVCLPWAGGGASFYTAWGRAIREDIEVRAMCLPGRESRFKEPCRSSLKETIDEIVNIISTDYMDKPFMFFGHSMGALLAFLVTLELKQRHKTEPLHMFLSGSHAPQAVNSIVRQNYTNAKSITKEEFCEKLKSLGGTPKEILEDKELMDIFLPSIQADYSILEEIKYESDKSKPPLSCSIDFFDGDEDKNHNLHEWQELTTGSFNSHSLPGGHFYIKNSINTDKIIQHINKSYFAYQK